MTRFRTGPVQLHDCQQHGLGSGSELFIVEGDSASKSVCRARDDSFQAVLPMQGKPLNAIKAGRQTVARNELFCGLVDALGAGWDDQFALQQMRYDRVILLFDPDADGIHCGALMLMFFHRWMPLLLESGRLSVIRPPLFEIRSQTSEETLHAYSEGHYRRLREALDESRIRFESQRYRGLASMSAAALLQTCLQTETRNIHRLTREDAEAAIRVFVGGSSET